MFFHPRFSSRVRRQSSVVQLVIELREDPVNNLSLASTLQSEVLLNATASIFDRYQSGQLQKDFAQHPATNGTSPISLSVQEPMSHVINTLDVVSRIALVTSPDSCREQSPCTTQPVIVAYDVNGNVIQKLGSIEYPWQVVATIVGQSNVSMPGGVANYTDGQSQYSLFGLPAIGSYQVQFTLVPSAGVNRSVSISIRLCEDIFLLFFSSSLANSLNLTVRSPMISVTATTIAGVEVDHRYVVEVNERFNVSVMPVDSITRRRLGQVMWGGWNWTVSVSLYSLPRYNRAATLIVDSTSRTLIDPIAGTVTVTNIAIDSIGMFMLSISLVSSNQQYTFQVRSSGILVLDCGSECSRIEHIAMI